MPTTPATSARSAASAAPWSSKAPAISRWPAILALNWSVQAGTLTSAAERFSGNASIAAGAALAFNQIADAAYGGTLSGAGAFIKTGAGTPGL